MLADSSQTVYSVISKQAGAGIYPDFLKVAFPSSSMQREPRSLTGSIDVSE